MMLFSVASGCALLATLIGSALSHNIQLGAHSRECFHEELHKDDKMTVTFQVADREFGGSGNLDIDFWVCAFPSVDQVHLLSRCYSFTTSRRYQRTILMGRAVDHRFRTRTVDTKFTPDQYRQATTPLMPNSTANTSTASAMSTGQHPRRKFRSTSMVSFTFLKQKPRATLWRKKVIDPQLQRRAPTSGRYKTCGKPPVALICMKSTTCFGTKLQEILSFGS